MIPATPLTSRHLAQPSLNLATQCMYEPTRYGTDLSLVPMTALCLLSSARLQLKKGPTLGDDWENRWKLSKWKISKGIAGEFVAPAGKWPSEEKEDTGIQTNEGSKFFGIDANFDSVSNEGKDLSIQYQAKHEKHLVSTAPRSIAIPVGYPSRRSASSETSGFFMAPASSSSLPTPPPKKRKGNGTSEAKTTAPRSEGGDSKETKGVKRLWKWFAPSDIVRRGLWGS